MLHSFHPDEQALFERLGIDGALPPVDGDFLSVRASNRGLNKIDAFMRRTVTDDVTVDPGRNIVHATVTVTVHNDAPGVRTSLHRHRQSPRQATGNELDHDRRIDTAEARRRQAKRYPCSPRCVAGVRAMGVHGTRRCPAGSRDER